MTTTVVVITPATPPGPTPFCSFSFLLFPRDLDDVKGEPPQFRLCDMKEDDERDTKMKKLWMKFWWIWNGFYFDITYVALLAARHWQQHNFSHGNWMMENGWPSPWLRQSPLDGQSRMMGMNNLIRFLLSASYGRVCIQGVAIDPNNPSHGPKRGIIAIRFKVNLTVRDDDDIIAIVTLSVSFDLFFRDISRLSFFPFSLFSHFVVKDDERRDQRSECLVVSYTQ